ncbi:MAG: ankyrin repeat domain-containing protein [Terracidiphilus sp.]
MNALNGCLLHLNVSRRVTALLLLSAALASASLGICGPIHEAARDGDIKKMELLLKSQPDLVSSKDEKYGQTPLHIAALNDRLDVAKLLLANKADVNAKSNNGSTPLHLAAGKGNKDMVELLLAGKADVNAVDNDGWSPAHSAITYGHKDIADLLSQNGGKDLPAPKQPPAATPPQGAEKKAPKEIGKDGQFIAYDDGTVLDTKTNLMWTARDNGAALSWPGAKSYAGSYHVGGYTDWRLPVLSELAGLYDKAKTFKTRCASAVDELGQAADEVHLTELIHLSCTRQWTAQEAEEKPGHATIFDFHSGSDASRPGSDGFTDTASRVLLVRTAKK